MQEKKTEVRIIFTELWIAITARKQEKESKDKDKKQAAN